MKSNYFFVAISVLLLVSCQSMYKQPYIKIEPDYVEVHFEKLMSKQVLDKLKTDLAANKIVIDYNDVKYDGEKLNFLSFSVTYNGKIGVGTTFFVQNQPYGFIIDNRPGKASRFVVGELKD